MDRRKGVYIFARHPEHIQDIRPISYFRTVPRWTDYWLKTESEVGKPVTTLCGADRAMQVVDRAGQA